MSTRLINCATLMAVVSLAGSDSIALEQSTMPGGELHILAPNGESVRVCPLQHTDVQADIIGYVGRVRVQQTFYNPLDEKIEAVYVFPLPEDSAVDDMIMTIGERAEDVFFIEKVGGDALDPDTQQTLRTALATALDNENG